MKRRYPDTSDIFARKEAGRRALAQRSFADKIAMVEALRERVEPLRQVREAARSKAGAKTGRR